MTVMERIEKMRVSHDALDLVFRKARTYNAWLPKPVPDELVRQLYDRLLLGLKGTMSEAELHVLKARLRGGILNKVRRGE